MATKRRASASTSTSRLNFRPATGEAARWESKGTKPLPERSSVVGVILMMVLNLCRKVMFVDIKKRIGAYLACLFVISLLADVAPIPKSYFSKTDNFLNRYFVKLGWAWTLSAVTPFVLLTSYTICCGRRQQVIQNLSRLAIATAVWFFCTSLFVIVENSYGKCSVKTESTKQLCLSKGHKWQTFDISGHTFILIYSTLMLIEEARAIIGWERIRDLIREENYTRTNMDESTSVNALGNLNEDDFVFLKNNYEKITPHVRTCFIFMTILTIIWDFMLLQTMLYFHTMVEKFLSGMVACVMWFITYGTWFHIPNTIPGLPGDGIFKYKDSKTSGEMLARKRIPKSQIPNFMGRPLTALRNQENDRKDSYNGTSLVTDDRYI